MSWKHGGTTLIHFTEVYFRVLRPLLVELWALPPVRSGGWEEGAILQQHAQPLSAYLRPTLTNS